MVGHQARRRAATTIPGQQVARGRTAVGRRSVTGRWTGGRAVRRAGRILVGRTAVGSAGAAAPCHPVPRTADRHAAGRAEAVPVGPGDRAAAVSGRPAAAGTPVRAAGSADGPTPVRPTRPAGAHRDTGGCFCPATASAVSAAEARTRRWSTRYLLRLVPSSQLRVHRCSRCATISPTRCQSPTHAVRHHRSGGRFGPGDQRWPEGRCRGPHARARTEATHTDSCLPRASTGTDSCPMMGFALRLAYVNVSPG